MRLLTISSAVLLTLLAASEAVAFQGAMQGSATFAYADYQAQVEGQPDEDATSFTQRYSLLYTGGAELAGGRVGYYKLALGAEYAAFSNSINGSDNEVDTFKPLYSGDLLLAPGGLPLRLHLYSRDLRGTTFLCDTAIGSSLLFPEIVTDVRNGTSRTTGANLLVGIRNGAYLGTYRDALSNLPRLLVDYREVEVESKAGLHDVHDITRDLAFVSLNKRDNWFHYRIRQYQDYLEPSGANDTQTNSYILGTIDPTLNRAWINLTNWIQISVDGSFVQQRKQQNAGEWSDTYALNLMARARRASGSASTYSSFYRIRDADGLDEKLSIPVYFNRTLSRDVGYAGNFIYRSRNELATGAGAGLSNENIYGLVRVETGRSQRYLLAPELAIESADSIASQGTAVQLGVEWLTNSRYRPTTDLKLRYVMRGFQGESAGESVNYLEQELSVRAVRRLRREWRYGLDEKLVYGDGNMSGAFTSYIRPVTMQSQMNSASVTATSGSVFRTLSSFFVEQNTLLYANRLQLNVDYLLLDSGGNLQSELSHRFDYGRGRVLSYGMENTVSQGDNQSRLQGDVGGGEFRGSASTADADLVYRHNSRLRYLPNRMLEGNLNAGYMMKSGATDSEHLIFGERLKYTFFQINGQLRRLAELTQRFDYELITQNGQQQSYYAFEGIASYYPTSILRLWALGRYESRPEANDTRLIARTGVNWDFPKFKLGLTYGYAERAVDGTLATASRQEQQLKATVEKIF